MANQLLTLYMGTPKVFNNFSIIYIQNNLQIITNIKALKLVNRKLISSIHLNNKF